MPPPQNEWKDDPLHWHATPTHYSIASSPKIIASEHFPPCRCPNKKRKSPMGLHHPKYLFKGKWQKKTPQKIIIRTNVKLPFFLNLHLTQPPLSIKGIWDSRRWRKAANKSNPQSLKSQWNITSQLRLSPSTSLTNKDSIESFWLLEFSYRIGKATLN